MRGCLRVRRNAPLGGCLKVHEGSMSALSPKPLCSDVHEQAMHYSAKGNDGIAERRIWESAIAPHSDHALPVCILELVI
jgi:hypothetical protein